MVSLDIYLNETSRHADVILPGLSPLEEALRHRLPAAVWRNHARYSAPVFAAPRASPGGRTCCACWPSCAARRRRSTALDDDRDADEVPPAGDHAPRCCRRCRTGPARSGCWTWRCAAAPTATSSAGARWVERGQRCPGHRRYRPGTSCSRACPKCCARPAARSSCPPMLLADRMARSWPISARLDALLHRVIGRRDVRKQQLDAQPAHAGQGPARCTRWCIRTMRHRLVASPRATLAHISRGPARIVAPVSLSAAMMPGVVSLPPAGATTRPARGCRWRPSGLVRTLNAVLDDGPIDPLSGNAVLSGVQRAGGAARRADAPSHEAQRFVDGRAPTPSRTPSMMRKPRPLADARTAAGRTGWRARRSTVHRDRRANIRHHAGRAAVAGPCARAG